MQTTDILHCTVMINCFISLFYLLRLWGCAVINFLGAETVRLCSDDLLYHPSMILATAFVL